jgi:hypothetical protein
MFIKGEFQTSGGGISAGIFSRRAIAVVLLLSLLAGLISGCATVPYHYGNDIESKLTLQLRKDEPQIERGRPVGWLDALGHYLISLPSKLILWNWQVDRHYISPLVEVELVRYLETNDLNNVKVRLNQYAPGGEWSRLARNRAMGGFWRWTLGALSLVGYTILPGRLMGGDNYNPYTNTISIYSNHPAILLHEAAHAKDFASRERPWNGFYAASRLLPIVPLYQEAIATGDAIGYLRDTAMTEEEKRAYKILYPAYGTYIGGQVTEWSWVSFTIWVRYAIYAGAVIPGHIIGRIKAATVEDEASQP